MGVRSYCGTKMLEQWLGDFLGANLLHRMADSKPASDVCGLRALSKKDGASSRECVIDDFYFTGFLAKTAVYQT